MRTVQHDSSCTIVIFGASGDLTRRKLIPALFNLFKKKRLPGPIRIVGFARRQLSHETFREKMLEGIQQSAKSFSDKALWEPFQENLYYQSGDFNDPGDFQRLNHILNDMEDGSADRLYYMATSPLFFEPIIGHLGKLNMANEERGWRRIVVEKPFGHDFESAQALNDTIHSVFNEDQVYRIDHFLGKETAQNVLFFRFGNTIFDPVWNRNYIDHVQITMAESVDVGHRAGYYDRAGILRDMFQNHILQLLALTAMEPPVSFEADAIRNEKIKIFSAIRPLSSENLSSHIVRGQYQGYLEAPGIDPDSKTATYCALRLYIDNWRWQGVPFYLRSGKAMAIKTTQIIIQFRCPPYVMFPMLEGQTIKSNMLALCIQPDEGIHLRFEVKVPDTLSDTRSVDMQFHYEDSFGQGAVPDAYERLLLDTLKGDASLFTRSDGIELAWRFMDPIIQGLERHSSTPLHIYEPGSWGPEEADTFMIKDNRQWVQGCYHGNQG